MERHCGETIDIAPVGCHAGQGAASARQIPGFFSVVAGHIVHGDRQVDLLLKGIEARNDERGFVSEFDETAENFPSLIGAAHRLVPVVCGGMRSSLRGTGEPRAEGEEMKAIDVQLNVTIDEGSLGKRRFS